MEQIEHGVTMATLLTYDLVTEDDPNICTEIKESLMDRGWRKNISCLTVIRNGKEVALKRGEDLPASSLWKVSFDSDKAIEDFVRACQQYDVVHSGDTPIKRAKGKAFAICSTMYNAVEISKPKCL